MSNIKNNFSLSAGTTATPANPELNRYRNIQLLDSSRVVLRTAGEHDYIHASHVLGGPFPMICAQGPLDRTINDFWTMVSENNLQLCKNIEEGRRKCADYLPHGKSSDFGHATVARLGKTTATPTNPKLKRTSLSVTMTGRKPMAVTHYQFDGWPDQNVPLDP
uniref:Tyrosine-protein phosphatase domain-containing protein n=1 Tax=Meloidogyne incognita TaxID=6306 RepID=A0A914L1B6_MELIC